MANQHSAGIFDIRNIIGALLSVYGIILLIMAFVGDQALEKTGGVNANLWTSIGLLIVGVFFLTWAALKPVIVVEPTAEDTEA